MVDFIPDSAKGFAVQPASIFQHSPQCFKTLIRYISIGFSRLFRLSLKHSQHEIRVYLILGIKKIEA